jgi:hypothetical protein
MSGDAASDQALSDLVKYGYIEDKSELKLGIAVTAGTGFFYNAMHYVTLPLFELSPAGIFKDAVSLPFGKDLVYGTKLKWWNYAMVAVPFAYKAFKLGIGLGIADEFLDIGDYMTKASSRTIRQAKLVNMLEENAARQLAKLESESVEGAHFFARHGAQTTLEQQKIRSMTGMTPDRFIKSPVDAGRFLTNQSQLRAIARADAIFKQTGERILKFDLGEIIGEGFLKGGVVYKKTSKVQAIYKNGKLFTIYPKLR